MILCAELVSWAASPDRYAQLAAAWLSAARAELFSGFDRVLAEGPAGSGPRDPTDLSAPWGEPGSVWARMRVQREPRLAGGRFIAHSPKTWQRLLAGLAQTYPFHITVEICPLDEAGRPAGGYLMALLEVHREHDHPEWVRLRAVAPSEICPWQGSAVVQQTWADFVWRSAGTLDACYGHIAVDSIFETDLERATGRRPADTVPRCYEELRGYSWVTVLAGELAGRLGGAEALAASGAFREVRAIANGSVWLRATPTIEEYRGEAVRRVFDALAPVLLPGHAEQPEGDPPWPHLVMGVDAADFR